MKKMRIKINRDGKVTVKVEGAVGDECIAFTRLFEKAIGDVEKRVYTEDYDKEKEQIRINQQEMI